METDWKSNSPDFFGMLIQHPAVQNDIAGFATAILHHALSVSEIREQIISSLEEAEVVQFVRGADRPREKKVNPSQEESLGRRQITARDAARIMGYNPRYFSRRAKEWGLTKIRMSRTSCRYYLDEVEQLAIERGIRKVA